MKGLRSAGCLFILSAFLLACRQNGSQPPLFELMENTGVSFNNQVEDGTEENSFQFRNFYNGGGVATGDLNNDGLPDIVFTSNQGQNKIYLNKGNFKFEDITAGSGLNQRGQWSTGVNLVDINNDGWLDIYICNSGHMFSGNRKNQLYINDHNLHFTESAAQYGLDHSGYATQAAFFDYDMDGDLDCFIIDNSPIPFSTLNYANLRDSPENAFRVPDYLKGGGNHLLRNDKGHFTEVTLQSGIHPSLLSFGLGLTVCDINGDGYPDIYVGNDFLEKDYLYINQGNGTFRDEMEDWLRHISMSSMGIDIADLNNDGFPDIYSTDMLAEDDYRFKTTGVYDNVNLYRSKVKAGYYQQYVRNCLQINNRNGQFLDMANISGTAASDWSWGLVLFDADNDGYNDIFVCNGINRDLGNLDFLDFFSNDISRGLMASGNKEKVVDEILRKIPSVPLPNKMFRNQGNLTFRDMGKTWGLDQPSFSNSAAYADLDNDGDLDLVVNNENGQAFIYQNHARDLNHNNYIALSVTGDSLNRFGIGTLIILYVNSQVLTREIFPARGFQSAMDYKQVIGLGQSAQVDSMIIRWPNRTVTRMQHPEVNKLLTIRYDQQQRSPFSFHKTSQAGYLEVSDTVFEKHAENDYVDFYHESNIPEMLSREGPRAAVGDVNGDGLDDIYVCGAAGQEGQLYLQTKQGQFMRSRQAAFELFTAFEDVAAVFFDCDGDGDNDLFVGAGGNEFPANSRELQHRLFLNDGKGHFTLDPRAFPSNTANTAVAVPCDIDGDGDLDLFVGSRNMPQEYGVDPPSHIYLNDGKGHFTEMDKSKTGGLSSVGMVTAAAWTDLLGTGRPQLIVVGDWMYPHIYSYSNGKFQEEKTSLSNLSGWWRAVAVEDLDGDGRKELVLGNIGENFYLRPDPDHPVKCWISDFDQNGLTDKIMTHTVDKRDLPVFLKHEMEFQLPALKKQNLLHKDFAAKSIQELLSSGKLDQALVKQFNYPASVIAWNKGNGRFAVQVLPMLAQISAINSILCTDINGDGRKDLVLAGNDLNFVPQFGRLDANAGEILINRGNRRLDTVDARQTGLNLRGDTRDMQIVSIQNKKYILILQNNERPRLYRCTQGFGLSGGIVQ